MKKLSVFSFLVLLLGLSILPVSSFAETNPQTETAWAGEYEFPGSNWALYFTKMIHCNPGCANLDTYTLWGGQNINVGTVKVINQPFGNDIFVQIETHDGWKMIETHVGFGNDLEDIPQNGGGNPIPGQFQINETHDPGVTIVTYQIPVPDGYCGFEGYIATHAVVQQGGNVQSQRGEQMDVFAASESLPATYELAQPYPNPFNASATVSVNLPEAAPLTVEVFSVTGQKVATLANGVVGAGQHELHFNATNLASGVYFVHAMVPGHLNEMKKVMLVR